MAIFWALYFFPKVSLMMPFKNFCLLICRAFASDVFFNAFFIFQFLIARSLNDMGRSLASILLNSSLLIGALDKSMGMSTFTRGRVTSPEKPSKRSLSLKAFLASLLAWIRAIFPGFIFFAALTKSSLGE